MTENISPDAGPDKPILSRVIEIEKFDDQEHKFDFSLDAKEQKALCEFFGLLAIEDWDATAWLQRTADRDGFVLRVTFAANVIQSCVVTLEPVRSRVQQTFTNMYLPEDRIESPAEMAGAEFFIDVEGDDFPEILMDFGIDVGDAIAQQFALALNPYPRLPGVEFGFGKEDKLVVANGGNERVNPFAALKSWQSGS